MEKKVLFLTVAVLISQVHGWNRAVASDIQSAYVKCTEKMNAPPYLRKQWQSFKFPTKESNKSACFVRCLLQEFGIIEKSRIMKNRLFLQIEPYIEERRKIKLRDHIEGCANEFKGHSCDKIHKVFLCLQFGYKKEVTKAFKAPKKIPDHTEL